ncbi:copper resistance protein NlpE [Paraflavitalea pollutisoli]|uniref:copper resistance protein NlpE n=1 Tax=Paraflavitalea pollutisoli TaxID=3034143 RepID=UPI0023ED8A1D|nr:copper resistance protein NlpE N-terminal domain-containing protein [Paraflavitalea sp. H1-2-19X]
MKILSSLSIVALLAVSCADENAGKTNEDAKGFDTAAKVQNPDSLATAAPPLISAVYSGVLPCADCEGQEVILTLMSDSSYRKRTLYAGKKASGPGSNEFTDTGKWVMQGDTLVLDIKNAPGRYVKEPESLIQLDQKGQRITGKLADKYVLKKTH